MIKFNNFLVLSIILSLVLFGCTAQEIGTEIEENLEQETPSSELVLGEDNGTDTIDPANETDNEEDEPQTVEPKNNNAQPKVTNPPKQEQPKQEPPKQEQPKQAPTNQEPKKQETKPSQPAQPSPPQQPVTEIKPEEPRKFQDGVYTGSAEGFDGPIKVKITVGNGKITEIEVTDHSDTPRFAIGAFERITNTMISRQELDVDIVSGATYSSKGFINAVKKALNK